MSEIRDKILKLTCIEWIAGVTTTSFFTVHVRKLRFASKYNAWI